jgi:hypothetical protein
MDRMLGRLPGTVGLQVPACLLRGVSAGKIQLKNPPTESIIDEFNILDDQINDSQLSWLYYQDLLDRSKKSLVRLSR